MFYVQKKHLDTHDTLTHKQFEYIRTEPRNVHYSSYVISLTSQEPPNASYYVFFEEMPDITKLSLCEALTDE